jgi:hypothetical protein
VLEEIWTLRENGDRAELGRLNVSGALPTAIAVEKMAEVGLLELLEHTSEPHEHRDVLNRCHEAVHPHPHNGVPAHGSRMIVFTAKGEQRAANIIRRHRLAERLFTETLHVENEATIEEQACKFEHILSFEATDKICTFLGHPKTCPHGSPIPPGCCCTQAKVAGLQK